MEVLSSKCTSIGVSELNKDFQTLSLNLIIWGAAMKLWEALLSSSALADTALNETCNYRNL